MAEWKNTEFDRPGGYAMPRGAVQIQKRVAKNIASLPPDQQIRMYGDIEPRHESSPGDGALQPTHKLTRPDTRVYVGDCREVLAALPDRGKVDLVFADPPFNWDVPYENWKDGMSRSEYERFTFDWLDGCVDALAPHGAIWVNIPDDTAAEVVMHLKRRGLVMINWCVWHFRFGQNRMGSFIMSKVHALYFVRNPDDRIWNPQEVLEVSDRASIYNDWRTQAKDDESLRGLRMPMDVWYGQYWGRIQGNNKERRSQHHNQIPEVYLERVIRSCSNEGSLVLDPFLGSGTTCTVARELKRKSIGIEYSAVNAKSAFERIRQGPVRVKRGKLERTSTAIFEKRSAAGKPAAAANGTVAIDRQ